MEIVLNKKVIFLLTVTVCLFFLDFRSLPGTWGADGDQSCDLVTSKSNLIGCFLDFLLRCTRQFPMLLYAHALLQIVTKKYHKRERTTSTANIKTKSSLLDYKTIPHSCCYFMRMRCWTLSQRRTTSVSVPHVLQI